MDIDWQRFGLEVRAGREATAFIRCLEAEIARLRLTDAEREAIDRAARFYADWGPEWEDKAATLRGLLERTK